MKTEVSYTNDLKMEIIKDSFFYDITDKIDEYLQYLKKEEIERIAEAV